VSVAIPIGDIVCINKTFEKDNLPFRVHLHDACGAQTLELQSVGGVLLPDETIRDIVRTFFKRRHRKIEFLLDGRTFRAIQ
jgi:hypothetical protein